MVQWVFEASRKHSLMDSTIHTSIKYMGMRNLFLEFHGSIPLSDEDRPPTPPSVAREPPTYSPAEQGESLQPLLPMEEQPRGERSPQPSPLKDEEPRRERWPPQLPMPKEERPRGERPPHQTPNRVTSFFNLRRRKSSTLRPSFDLEESGPSSSEPYLSPSTTITSSSRTPPSSAHDDQHSSSFTASLDLFIHRFTPGRSGSK